MNTLFLEIKSEKGFTIIEAMVSVFILTLGITAVLCLFPLSLQARKFSEMKTVATQLAQAEMEEVISLSYDNILIGTATESPLDPPFGAYSRQMIVDYVDSDLVISAVDTGLKKIEVLVSWNSSLSISDKNVRIISLIATRGPGKRNCNQGLDRLNQLLPLLFWCRLQLFFILSICLINKLIERVKIWQSLLKTAGLSWKE